MTLNGESRLIAEAKTRTQGDITLHEFKYSVTSKEMGKIVVLHAYDGAGNLLPLHRNSSGEDITQQGYPYSVQTYIQNTVRKNTDAKLVALVKAMSDYGSKAQVQFNYDVANAAEIYNPEAIAAVTLQDLALYERVKIETERKGMSYYGSNLTLDSMTIARLLFTVESGSLNDYHFTLDGTAVEPGSYEGYVSIEIPSINARDLDKLYTVEVHDSEGVFLTVKYGALSYAYQKVSKEATETPALVELCKALYLYSEAANGYFGS